MSSGSRAKSSRFGSSVGSKPWLRPVPRALREMRSIDCEAGESAGFERTGESPAPLEDRPPGVDPALDAVLVITGPRPRRSHDVHGSLLEGTAPVGVLLRHVLGAIDLADPSELASLHVADRDHACAAAAERRAARGQVYRQLRTTAPPWVSMTETPAFRAPRRS